MLQFSDWMVAAGCLLVAVIFMSLLEWQPLDQQILDYLRSRSSTDHSSDDEIFHHIRWHGRSGLSRERLQATLRRLAKEKRLMRYSCRSPDSETFYNFTDPKIHPPG